MLLLRGLLGLGLGLLLVIDGAAGVTSDAGKKKSDFVKSGFNRCDLDRDGRLQRTEFSVCVVRQINQDKDNPLGDHNPLQASDSDLRKLFDLIDTNADGQLSLMEYGKMFSRLHDPKKMGEKIEMKTKDGSTVEVTQEELFAKIREQTKGFRVENDQILKEESKTAKLETLEKEDPALARVISMGQWALEEVQRNGHAFGSLVRIRSIDDGDKEKAVAAQNLVNLAIEVRPESGGTPLLVQVQVEFDPRKHPHSPHFALLAAREMQPDGGSIEYLLPVHLVNEQSSPPEQPPSRASAAAQKLDFVHKLLRRVVLVVAPWLGVSIGRGQRLEELSPVLPVLVMVVCVVVLSLLFAGVAVVLYNAWLLVFGDDLEPGVPDERMLSEERRDKKRD